MTADHLALLLAFVCGCGITMTNILIFIAKRIVMKHALTKTDVFMLHNNLMTTAFLSTVGWGLLAAVLLVLHWSASQI